MSKAKPTFDPRELRQIINNNLASVDVIINERDTFFRTITPKDRYTSKTETCRADDAVGTIRAVLCFFLSSTKHMKKQSVSNFSTKYTCCIETNSASIATKVPGLGSSSKESNSCRIRFSSRCLRAKMRKKDQS